MWCPARTPGRRLLGAAAAGLLLAAGCGDDGGSAPATPTTEASGSPTTGAPASSTSTPSTTAPTTTTTEPPGTTVAEVAAGARPRLAAEPEAVAAQLIEGEATVRDPGASPAEVRAAGLLVQLAYRALAAHPEWDAPVTAALHAGAPHLVAPVTRIVAARRDLRSMHTELSDTLPAWRIVEPLPAEELLGMYREAEARFGVPWHVLAAIHLVETGMGRIQGLSTAGAQGPMQFMPATWAAYGLGGDVTDHRDAIHGAANYLAANGGAAGTREALERAVWHYNHSDQYVRAVLAYSDVLAAEPITYRGFHAWDVLYLNTEGTIRLEPGYEADERIPATDYLRAHPDALVE